MNGESIKYIQVKKWDTKFARSRLKFKLFLTFTYLWKLHEYICLVDDHRWRSVTTSLWSSYSSEEYWLKCAMSFLESLDEWLCNRSDEHRILVVKIKSDKRFLGESSENYVCALNVRSWSWLVSLLFKSVNDLANGGLWSSIAIYILRVLVESLSFISLFSIHKMSSFWIHNAIVKRL